MVCLDYGFDKRKMIEYSRLFYRWCVTALIHFSFFLATDYRDAIIVCASGIFRSYYFLAWCCSILIKYSCLNFGWFGIGFIIALWALLLCVVASVYRSLPLLCPQWNELSRCTLLESCAFSRGFYSIFRGSICKGLCGLYGVRDLSRASVMVEDILAWYQSSTTDFYFWRYTQKEFGLFW